MFSYVLYGMLDVYPTEQFCFKVLQAYVQQQDSNL